jgi:hypothetical protein
MHIHVIGITTTFMTGIAVLAKQAGNQVTVSDCCVDPATRRTLEESGVQLLQGFNPENLAYKPDLVVIEKGIDSNNQELETARRFKIPYVTGSEWLEKFVLNEKLPQRMLTSAEEEKNKKPKPSNPHLPKPKEVKHAPKIPPESNSKLKRTTN